jgi:hypothetical protein
MQRSWIVAGLAVASLVAGCSPPRPAATVDAPTSIGGVISTSALSIVKERVAAIASPSASSVTVVWAADQFVVTVENSELNRLTHSARNSEATTIAETISTTIANMPEFAGLLGVHIDYVARGGDIGTKIVDRIDFRKDSMGRLSLHAT